MNKNGASVSPWSTPVVNSNPSGVSSAVTTLALVNIGVHQSNGHKQPLVEFHMPSGS